MINLLATQTQGIYVRRDTRTIGHIAQVSDPWGRGNSWMVSYYTKMGQHSGLSGPHSWHTSILDAVRKIRR